MARCAAQESAEHIASAFVGRKDSVAGHKRYGTDVVRNQTDGNVLLRVGLIGHTGDLAHAVTKCLHGVDIEHGVRILAYHGETLKSHTGIDILVGQFFVTALAVAVELGKHVVPNLNVAVAIAAHLAVGLSAAESDAAVIVNLRAGTAGTCAVLPEVVLFAEAEDAVRRNAHFLVPDVKCLIVIEVYRRIQTILRKAYDLRQKLPAPGNGLVFKVIAEGEVSEHLEERAVSCGLAYVLDIAGTNTLLARCNAASRRNLLPRKVRLQGSHTGVDQQKALIVLGNEGETRQTEMSLALKEREIHLTQFVNTVILHCILPPGIAL